MFTNECQQNKNYSFKPWFKSNTGFNIHTFMLFTLTNLSNLITHVRFRTTSSMIIVSFRMTDNRPDYSRLIEDDRYPSWLLYTPDATTVGRKVIFSTTSQPLEVKLFSPQHHCWLESNFLHNIKTAEISFPFLHDNKAACRKVTFSSQHHNYLW